MSVLPAPAVLSVRCEKRVVLASEDRTNLEFVAAERNFNDRPITPNVSERVRLEQCVFHLLQELRLLVAIKRLNSCELLTWQYEDQINVGARHRRRTFPI